MPFHCDAKSYIVYGNNFLFSGGLERLALGLANDSYASGYASLSDLQTWSSSAQDIYSYKTILV